MIKIILGLNIMLEIKLFKFDSKTDYLPYYRSYEIELDNIDTIVDVLNAVHKIEKFGYIKDEKFFLRVNNTFVSSDVQLSEVITQNNELLLEPLSINRAVDDLIIDTKDYQKKLNFLDRYFSVDEKALIIKEKIYMLEYYASNTLHFNSDYIGEHVLFLASELIEKDATLKQELSTLVDVKDGIRIRSSLQYRVLNANVEATSKFTEVYLDSEPVQYLDNFNISLFCGLNNSSFEKSIKKSNASYVELKSKHFDIPMSCSKLSYLMAGNILLEAKDNNADFLIVNNDAELKLFDAKQKNIEKIMGREIELPVLTRDEFTQLLKGNTNFNDRKITIPFVA